MTPPGVSMADVVAAWGRRDSAVEPMATTSEPEIGEQSFWTSRPELAHVFAFARSRMASPWATLGVVLVRVLSQVPPEYVLPPIGGTFASLNLFAAVVAPSGSGKGLSMGAAKDAVKLGHVETWPIGTGEGIVKSYVHFELDEATDVGFIRQHEKSVVFEVHEVDKLTAIRGRQGSTILSILRSGWIGEEIGFGNAELERRLKVEEHAYRMGLVIGVQPGRGAVLLNPDEIAGGTPQRFLWLLALDPDIPDVTPGEPGQWAWELPPWPVDVEWAPGRYVLDVWDGAKDELRTAIRQQVSGRRQADPLDSHAGLCKEKVAAALGLLNGHCRITEEDWRLAGVVMRVSDQTRQYVLDSLAEAAAEDNRARGRSEGERQAVKDEKVEATRIERTAKAVLTRLGKLDEEGWMSASDLYRSLRADTQRPYFDHVLGVLDGRLESKAVYSGGTTGTAYRLRPTA